MTFNSIAAVDASTLYVSYYDRTDDDLFVAKSTDGGATWTPTRVDGGAGDTNNSQDVGSGTSIAVVDTSTLYVSYYDDTDGDLFVAKAPGDPVISVTLEPKDDAPPGFYVLTGEIVQTTH